MLINPLRVKPLLIFSLLLLPVSGVQAAISLDRTRVIYTEDSKSVSLSIRNDNKELPFLAQSWVENERQQKVTEPFAVLPPLQRVEPGSGGQVKLVKVPGADNLPQDRESLFYFNLREVPPRSDKPNTMQIALQTKIKLFYRPKAVAAKQGEVWQEQLVLRKEEKGFQLENPTPYYVTITDLVDVADKRDGSNFDPLMLAPFSSARVSASAQAPIITFVNDYGGYEQLKYSCSGAVCQRVELK